MAASANSRCRPEGERQWRSSGTSESVQRSGRTASARRTYSPLRSRLHARGGHLCVWKLDRLGRSTKDVLTIAEDLHARGIALRFLTGTLAGNYSPKGEGKFFLTMMVASAEPERDMIVERTRAGLDAAKAQGRTGGRPTVITEDVLTVAKARKAKGESGHCQGSWSLPRHPLPAHRVAPHASPTTLSLCRHR
ncbi:recombinase family protein [Streptomyces lunaelactis]|uniref:recombinase family protein n=1 Tax=Streptomyces lunaelactis TaxID=1535768 RepID=UPI0028168A46|nr:recombinase family protein [Streptomyces lunaelactis]